MALVLPKGGTRSKADLPSLVAAPSARATGATAKAARYGCQAAGTSYRAGIGVLHKKS
jgi:hypothetical protein